MFDATLLENYYFIDTLRRPSRSVVSLCMILSSNDVKSRRY
jgi:hypothetical protein